MFEYYNNILCVQAGWLYNEASIITFSNYKKLKKRGWLNVLRRGCKGTPALVEFDSMKTWIKETIVKKYGDPYKKTKHYQFKDAIQPDGDAATFYSSFKLVDGRNLPEDTQREYRTNAEILNAIHHIVGNQKVKRKALGGSTVKIWDKITIVVNKLDKTYYPHTLPTNTRRLKERYKSYKTDGYTALIHKNFGNNNSRKVTAQLEHLILSLYTLPNKPYTIDVHDLYLQFLGRAIDVVDVQTGELFNADDFYENGTPLTISESTVWNYINDPKNRVLVDKFRSGTLQYNSKHRPHVNRHAPQFSLSKISMDDRDLPRKMHDGKRVKAYYSYDVTSGCVIGSSYSKDKDKKLFINCMRDMFLFLHKNNLGIPMEVEVEHHLVSSYKDDLMQAGIVFPFVRWANPSNAQEKYAETMNRVKKYGFEKRYQDGIGRFYNKLEANRVDYTKVYDAENDNYKENTFDFEQLVADDLEVIQKFNNSKHPNQKKYKGMSRLEVLLFTINPNLAKYDESLLARYIGDSRKTSIRRSQYVVTQYRKYQLPSPNVLSALEPNNLNVEAFWLPGEDGTIDRVHLYQNGKYVCQCDAIETFNTARSEWTDTDDTAYTEQMKYITQYDGMVKEGTKEIGKVKVIANTNYYEDVEPETVETVPDTPKESNDFDELMNAYNEDAQKQNAVNSL